MMKMKNIFKLSAVFAAQQCLHIKAQAATLATLPLLASGSSGLKEAFQMALGVIFLFGFVFGIIKIWGGANALSKGDPDGKMGIFAGIIIAGAAAIMGALFSVFGLSGGELTPTF